MSKHTPGPWIVPDRQDLGRPLPGTSIFKEQDDGGPPKFIASIDLHGVVLGEEEFANARLIAAAPDMLAALEAVAEELKYGRIEPSDSVHRSVCAAIAKAEGEPES